MGDAGEVLVLDDEAIVCERLEDHLGKLGFRVETFTESELAIDRLRERAFDVVVTDLKMRGPTGLEVLQFVREQGPGTQVIIITGFATMEAARDAEYAGVLEFISKPFELATLGKLVKAAAKKARRLRGGTLPQSRTGATLE
jgi:DNA-binding NtrC family response regulator